MVEITPATDADVPTILGFIRALAAYEKLSHEVTATEASLRQTLFGETRYAEALVGRVDGTPAGYALFFHNYSTFRGRPGLYLEDLFVLPAFRGRGVGRALLVATARVARDRNCARFEWTVLDWNAPAIAFYRRVGAAILPDWRVCRMDEQGIVRLVSDAGVHLTPRR